jgi:serine O-acetyltransferase
MARTLSNIASLDPVWSTIRTEADQIARDEPLMASLVHAGILHHSSLERALSYRIAQKLASPEMSDLILREIADARARPVRRGADESVAALAGRRRGPAERPKA